MRISTVAEFRKMIRAGQFTFPGMYEVFGVCDDGGTLCFPCMDRERRVIASAIGSNTRDGWNVQAVDATCNTDAEVRCDNCNRVVQEAWNAAEA